MTTTQIIDRVMGAIAAVITLVLLSALVTALIVQSVGAERRTHAERMAEIAVCRVALNPADCFKRMP